MGVERRGDADDDRVGFRQPGEVGGRLELLLGEILLQLGRGDVLDIALAAVEHRHLAGVDVEAEDPEALVDEGLDQGQSDDADHGAAVEDLLFEGLAELTHRAVLSLYHCTVIFNPSSKETRGA